MFTGLHVPEHRVVSRFDKLAPSNTVWERLRDEHGYDTGVFSENPFITSDVYGLDVGFDDVVTGLPNREYPFAGGTNPTEYLAAGGDESDKLGYLRHVLSEGAPVRSTANAVVRQLERTAPELVPKRLNTHQGNKSRAYADAFLDWQVGRSDWAACINFTDVHHPYRPTERYDLWGGPDLLAVHDAIEDHRWSFYSGREPWWKLAALEWLYDGCIYQIDDSLQRIVHRLRSRDQIEDTLLIITADHGEGFGEASRVRQGFRIAGHAGGIHERLLHVPLVVSWPDDRPAERIEEPVSLTEFPTVVERLLEGATGGFRPEGPVLATADVDAQYEYSPKSLDAFRDSIDESMFGGFGRAVYRDGDGSFVRKFARWEDASAVIDIYDAQSATTADSGPDPDEEIDAAFAGLEDADVRRPNDRPSDLDPGTRQRLEDLGYV